MNNQTIYQQAASLVQAGRFTEAETLLDSFLEQQPDDEMAVSIYGSMLLRQNDSQRALDLFRRNTSTHQTSWGAWADLGFAAMRSDEQSEALEAFGQAVSLNPDFYQGWTSLETLHYNAGDMEAALEASEQGERLDPMDAEYEQIQQLMQSDQKGKAERIARGMLQRQAGHPRAAHFLAHLANTVGAHEQEAEILRHGLEHHPANVMLRRALVKALEAAGYFEAALAEAKLLVALQEDYMSLWQLSRMSGHVSDSEGILAATERAANLLPDGSEDLGKVDLLRGHALRVLGRREESVAAYRSSIANTPENGAAWWGLADMKIYRFSEADMAAMQAMADSESVEGEQRCLAAFALARAHENAGNTSEAIESYFRANALKTDVMFRPDVHQGYYERIKESGSNTELQADPPPAGPRPIFIVGMPRAGSTLLEQILSCHSQIEGTMELMTLPHLERRIRIEGGRRFQKEFPESLGSFSADDLRRFGQSYLDESAVFRSGKPFFIDKLPPNFERIDLIHKILPQAIIIDARRHPMDCGFSAFKQHFAAGHPYSYDLAHIGVYYNAYIDLMDHWDHLLPDKICRVHYEKMIDDPEAMIRRVLDHIGLPFEDACLRFHENTRAVKTASSEQVRQPINRKGIGVWRKFAKELEPLRLALGEETMARFQTLE